MVDSARRMEQRHCCHHCWRQQHQHYGNQHLGTTYGRQTAHATDGPDNHRKRGPGSLAQLAQAKTGWAQMAPAKTGRAQKATAKRGRARRAPAKNNLTTRAHAAREKKREDQTDGQTNLPDELACLPPLHSMLMIDHGGPQSYHVECCHVPPDGNTNLHASLSAAAA